jgi:hypothetical protein
MDRKKAVSRLVLACVILTILLLTKSVSLIAAGIIFVIILLVLGIRSRGFTRNL